MNQKDKQQLILKFLWLLHTKKVDIKARIRIQPKRSGSATLRNTNIFSRRKITGTARKILEPNSLNWSGIPKQDFFYLK
jgi:hypothetical protein